MPPTVNAPPVVSTREEDSMNTEASMSGKKIIGLIYPPPDIRTIVDKTANFVARNGLDFENKIREKEASNPRFSFLSATDPYNAYYKHKVKELSEGKGEPTIASKPTAQLPEAVKEAVKKAEAVPTKPPPSYEFMADPATINSFDLDLIKLTAMFVARNGRQFMTNLINREMKNYQFDFLKPQHSNFPYFTKLVEQYTKVMIPSKNIVEELRRDIDNKKKLLAEVDYRVRWAKHQKSLKEKEEAEMEKERVAYAQVDWHDFVVVQTVDFSAADLANLPSLCTPQDVGARILLEARKEQEKATQDAAMDMEESESEEEQEIDNEVGESAGGVDAIPPPSTARPPEVDLQPSITGGSKQSNFIVRDDYDPKKNRQPVQNAADDWLVSPLTGERIPKSKLAEHVRYNTVDSQYKEDREAKLAQSANEEQVYAPGTDISRNLGKFADRRTDIFGVGEEGAKQTVIGKKLGEADTPIRPMKDGIWDGTAETMEAATRAAQSKVTLDQQIKELHKQHGFAPDPEKEKIGAQKPNQQQPPPPRGAPPPMPPMPQGVPRAPQPIILPPGGLPPPVSIPSGAFNPAMVLHPPLQNIQIPQIAVPMVPVVNVIPTSMMQVPQQPSAVDRRPPMEEQPPAKKQRTEDDLEPEADWLQKVPSKLEVRVQLPQAPELQMDGSIVAFEVQSGGMVSSLKQQIQERYQMPANKQKLTFDGFFLKDASTFAFYNMGQHAFVILQKKERGGRK